MPRNHRAFPRKTGESSRPLGISGNVAEYVLDYLANSFPTQLYEPFTDSEGNLSSRPVFRDGQPVRAARPSPAGTG